MTMSRRRIVQITEPARLLALAALGIGACDGEGMSGGDLDRDAVEIRYTEYGIPHIRAGSYEGIGFGQGYAQARENLCDIQHGMLAFEGKLSRYFGPDVEGAAIIPTGMTSLVTDLYYRGVNDSGVVERLVAQAAPLGPRDELRQLVRGYVAGFNALLAERPALRCIDEAWVRPMTELDVYRRAYAMSTVLGGAVFSEAIVSAMPPVVTALPATRSSAPTATFAALTGPAAASRPGSNGIALGGEATRTGGGLNVANPHLSWGGDLRWSQAQLTLGDELDVSGAGVLGLPLIVMGHTATAAWSITTAETATHFTLFELQLAEDSPTSYLVDGVPEPMQRRDVSVEVLRADGTVATVTHAQWSTRYGPVISGEASGLPWIAAGAGAPGVAYAVGDPNASNMRMLNTLLAFDHSRSVDDVHQALRENQGAPWWTVMAADAEGQALFSQIHVVPNVPDAHAERCNTELVRASFMDSGFAVLDGARSECAWLTDPDAVEPGIFGPGQGDDLHLPALITRRYVANSNDSYWQPNAQQRITGLARILGDERTPRSLRTRDTFTEIEDQLARGPFDRAAMQELVFSHRSYAAELVMDETLAMCRGLGVDGAESSAGQLVDVSEACSVLEAWDRRLNVDSRGALLFDRYWRGANELGVAAGVSLFSTPFDAADPLGTPRTLDVDGPVAARALADAVLGLAEAGIALDAALGDHQYVERGGARLPLGGGTDVLGVFNLLHADWSPERGYTGPFKNGSGYMHIVELDGTPCPDAVSLISYSQSVEASSPHHADQTALYSQKRWVTERFCEDDILDSPALEIVRLEHEAQR
jgi:acyl-homoserine-lactone acylase